MDMHVQPQTIREFVNMAFCWTSKCMTLMRPSLYSSHVRQFGVFDGVKEKFWDNMEERKKKKQDHSYKEQLAVMVQHPKFDLNVFEEMLRTMAKEGGATGWKSKLPGISAQPEIAQLNNYLSILSHIPPDTKTTPHMLMGKEKREVGEKSGQSNVVINNMVRQFEQMRSLHGWVRKRTERQLPLPETAEDTDAMVRADPTGFVPPKPKKKRR